MLPAAAERGAEERRDDRVGGLHHVHPHRVAHEPRVPLQRTTAARRGRRRAESAGGRRSPAECPWRLAARGSAGSKSVIARSAPKASRVAQHPVDERPELPSLVVEPGRRSIASRRADRRCTGRRCPGSRSIRTRAWPVAKPPRQKIERVGGREDQQVVVVAGAARRACTIRVAWPRPSPHRLMAILGMTTAGSRLERSPCRKRA